MFYDTHTVGYTTAGMIRDIEASTDENSVEWHLKLVLPRIKSMARKATDTTNTYINTVRPGVRGYDDVVTELLLVAMDAYNRYNPFLGIQFVTWCWQFLINRLHELTREDATPAYSLDDSLCATIFTGEYLSLAELLVDEEDLAERVQATDNAIQYIKLLAASPHGVRKQKVLTLLTQGLTQEEISTLLHVNQSTVSRDIAFIRTQAESFARENKFSHWVTYIEMKAGDSTSDTSTVLCTTGK